MKILVTGAAGFIGSYTVKALLHRGYEVVGLDNINAYYAVDLKYARLADVGIARTAVQEKVLVRSSLYSSYRFVQLDLVDREALDALFASESFEAVINLAAQAGVRYSIENPIVYVESNVMGFLHLLENCRRYPVKHLVYASSSSVYGLNKKVPFAETDLVDTPVSLYAATKKSGELMAHAYSALYGIPTTGLRFFTVYGPWGRPDMAPYLFMKAVMNDRPIQVFNHGRMKRDFTYIDDVVEGVMKVVEHPFAQAIPYRIYNIGNSSPVELLHFISVIEQVTGKKAVKQMANMQQGDVVCTYADTARLQRDFGYHPSIPVEEGIRRFYQWYVAHPEF
ncbi:MAG: NAD-dependent epimerase/dehydratase family protein [Bacteroides sp.]